MGVLSILVSFVCYYWHPSVYFYEYHCIMITGIVGWGACRMEGLLLVEPPILDVSQLRDCYLTVEQMLMQRIM